MLNLGYERRVTIFVTNIDFGEQYKPPIFKKIGKLK